MEKNICSFISIRSVVVHEWDSVLPDIQSIGDDDSEILDTVLKDELRLLYDEAMNRIIINNLSHGLSVGRIKAILVIYLIYCFYINIRGWIKYC